MAKKHLGQNFLKSKQVVHTMIRAADIQESDIVVEVGPGKGAITAPLLFLAQKLIAFEKDADLIPLLQEKFFDHTNFELHEQDILEFDSSVLQNGYKVVANIPYYITGAIIRHFLESSHQPKSMTLLVQKEVADRIVARDRKESILSLSVKVYGVPKIITKVGREYFSPKPDVDSAVIHISDISKSFFKNFTEEQFFTVIKQAFQFKRKNIVNNLKKEFPHIESVLKHIRVNPKIRAEDLGLDDFAQIIQSLYGTS